MRNPFLVFYSVMVGMSATLALFPFAGYLPVLYLLMIYLGLANSTYQIGDPIFKVKGAQ